MAWIMVKETLVNLERVTTVQPRHEKGDPTVVSSVRFNFDHGNFFEVTGDEAIRRVLDWMGVQDVRDLDSAGVRDLDTQGIRDLDA